MLVIACGALAREVLALKLDWVDLTCLPASLHNRPERIPEAMRAKIRANRAAYDEILCLYGDCGTGGELDRVLAEEGVKRIAGAHCYAFYAGEEAFAALAEEEPGTFYLTDFLARHFDTLVIEGLGLDRFPAVARRLFRRLPAGRASRAGRRSGDDGEGEGGRRAARARLRAPLHRPRRTGAVPDRGDARGRGPEGSRHGQPDHRLLARHPEPGHRQVRAEGGQTGTVRALHPRHRRAAMHAGAKSADDYLADWRRGEPVACGDDLESEAEAAAARLEAEYDTHRLALLAKHDGRERPR